jgi:hypothetical protein
VRALYEAPASLLTFPKREGQRSATFARRIVATSVCGHRAVGLPARMTTLCWCPARTVVRHGRNRRSLSGTRLALKGLKESRARTI